MNNFVKILAVAATLAVGAAAAGPVFANPNANDNPYYPDHYRYLLKQGR
ncbi:MAG: hypothetical protein WBB88_12080 [Methyloceanibacter sp.]